MSWHTIKEMDRAHLRKRYGNPPLRYLRFLAIDEIAYKKGHRYKTIVYDLEAKRAVYVGDGRSVESIKPFLQKVRRSKANIEAIATDMWVPYWSTVQDVLPDALIVFDLFHIVKQFGLTLDKIRVSLFTEETELNRRQLIKGTRWLLLKNRENLSDTPRLKDGKTEIDRLEEAFRINEPLAKAYILKESLTNIWKNCNGTNQAKKAFDNWIKDARAMKNKHMDKFCDLLLSHRTGILNWHKYQISTGPLEGFNNKIKVLKRSAYGFRDDDYFALRVLALHESRYALLR
jgi:transposase